MMFCMAFAATTIVGCAVYRDLDDIIPDSSPDGGQDSSSDVQDTEVETCTAKAYSQCVDRNVYWFDSCHEQGEMKSECTDKFYCVDRSGTLAQCGCTNPSVGVDTDCDGCLSDGDCPGQFAICSPSHTCTCWQTNSDTDTSSCTTSDNCPNNEYVCAKDSVSTPAHYICLRTCTTEATTEEAVDCVPRETVELDTALVWAPETTCAEAAAL